VKRGQREQIDKLREVNLFASCSDDELGRIDHLITQIAVDEGRALTREGEHGKEFVIVVEGTAGVFKGDEQVAEIGPGSFLGEIGLLFDVPRTATVKALTPMTIDVLNLREFRELLEASPDLRGSIEAAARTRFGEITA
jgi:ATP-binding cassette subfamily B protein